LDDYISEPTEGCAGIRVEILPGALLFLVAVLLWNGVGMLIVHAANAAVPLGSEMGVRGGRAAL